MKKLFVLGWVLLSGSAYAFGPDAIWQKVLDCDSGAAVIDENVGPCTSAGCPGGGTVLDYQLVIRDIGIIDYFNKIGVWRSNYGDREIIVQGTRGYQTPKDSLTFRRITDCYAPYNDCKWVDVYPEGDGVKVAFTQKRAWCKGPITENGCEGDWAEEQREVGNWYFRSCQKAPYR